MKRLIEQAYKQIREYLDNEGIMYNGNIKCMSMDIDWKDVPDDLDLTGYEIKVFNVLYPNTIDSIPSHLSITYDSDGNRINIQLPMWLKAAIFASRIQGQQASIDLLQKLTTECKMIYRGETIPYDNTVA